MKLKITIIALAATNIVLMVTLSHSRRAYIPNNNDLIHQVFKNGYLHGVQDEQNNSFREGSADAQWEVFQKDFHINPLTP